MAKNRPKPEIRWLARPSLGSARVVRDVGENRRVLMHDRLDFEIETDDYVATIVASIGDGVTHAVDEISIRRKPTGRLPDADLLRSLRIGDVLRRAARESSEYMVRDERRDRWLIEAHPTARASAIDAATRPRGRRPEPERIDEQAGEVAKAWNAALRRGLRAPRQYVADQLHMAPRTVTRRVDRARELGLIEERD